MITKPLKQIIIDRREQILTTATKYGATNLLVFGSVARGDEHDTSDLDLLVEFEVGRSLFDHAGLVAELEQLVGRTVQLGTIKGLLPRYRDRILREAIPI